MKSFESGFSGQKEVGRPQNRPDGRVCVYGKWWCEMVKGRDEDQDSPHIAQNLGAVRLCRVGISKKSKRIIIKRK